MKSYTVTVTDQGGVSVLAVTGYISVLAGVELHAKVDELLRGGCDRYVVDFAGCGFINSPGMVQMLELAMKIIEVHSGRLMLTGLDPCKVSVFTMTGVLPLATTAPTVEAALQKLA